ncbi:MAG: DUF2927 domain-containing protein [Cyanobacteria bacterium P01_A01_bin.68]
MNIKQIFVSGISHTIALSIASITILGIAIPDSEAQTAILTAKNSTSEINLRLAPTTKSDAVDYGKPGDRIIIRNQTKSSDGYTWYFVKLEESGITGWVRGDLIAMQSPKKHTLANITNFNPTPSEDSRKENQESRAKEMTSVILQQEGSREGSNQKSQQAYLPKRRYTTEEIDYFQEIAFGAEYSTNSSIIRKWQGDLRIKVIGKPTSEDFKTLKTVINEINNLTSGINLKIVDNKPNVKIHFVPVSEFKRYEPNYQPGNDGYAWVNWNQNNIIYSANILVTTTGINQKERSHLIREELTQSLGLLKDSYKHQNSIFYQPWTDINQYSQLDKTLIQILYQPEILPGMTKSQVASFLKRG